MRDPNDDGSFLSCPFLTVTGHQCPGCGTLRALRALTGGDVGSAVGLNALTTGLLPVLAVGWVLWLRATLTGRPAPQLPVWLGWAVAAVVPLFWVARNLAPFAALAP